jgi:uncharacterized repeat protein (TIGR03803 family)
LGLALIATAAQTTAADAASNFRTLYSFIGGNHGQQPRAGLTYSSGDFYGTTFGGGSVGSTVFDFDANAGIESVLHAFTGGSDGGGVNGGLLYEGGVLYGETESGGEGSAGVVFLMNAKTGAEKILYNFIGAPDGDDPTGTLIQENGVLYGTTTYGGSADYGTIFQLNPTTGAYQILYDFQGAPDGKNPAAGVIYKNGALYGTTVDGGESGNGGTVYKFDLTTGTETVLYRFTNGADGGGPYAALLAKGNMLYGTTTDGGAHSHGTVFKVDASTGKETVLHSFSGGKDGGHPFTAPLIDMGGMLYGSTDSTVFQIDPKTGVEKTLHANLQHPNGLDAKHRKLYGTTYEGGKSNLGTIFELTP